MELCFTGDLDGLREGLRALAGLLPFRLTPTGEKVEIRRQEENSLTVGRTDGRLFIRYRERIHFFRAVGLLVEHLQESADDFSLTEEPQFTMNGAMFDVSQGNAVINVQNVKNILNRMAVMGLNMLMLYAEDSFEVEGEPYFGYMRSKYTYDELKELDDYADQFGIEMIPCVQTLAHLVDALKWAPYAGIRDDDDTLLVGSPGTYELIDKIIRSASAPFRSRRIHIGMDEAWKLGQGEYLKANGYRNKFDIMTEHLDRVVKITEKYGLQPMIWSDMYFRAGSPKGKYYDTDCVIPEECMRKKPRDVQLVYWDYYHADEAFYIDWIERHRRFGADPIFAGGIWSWTGFSVNYGLTIQNSNAALAACKKTGIRGVFTTIWGDDGTESNVYCNLLGLQLFAEQGYSRRLDMAKLKKRFAFCTGCRYDDFMALGMLDEIPGCKPGNPENINPCKYLTWQDPMLGLFDKNVEGHGLSEHYRQAERRMAESGQRNGEYGFLFKWLQKLCAVLALKGEIGLQLCRAYGQDDREQLGHIRAEVLPELTRRVKELREFHRGLWMRINKPAGWEILDGRYGFLLARLDTAAFRLGQYLAGEVPALEELEQPRLNFQCEEGPVACNVYNRMPSASRISSTTFYIF